MKNYILDWYDGEAVMLVDDMSDGARCIIQDLLGKQFESNIEPLTRRLGYLYVIEFPAFQIEILAEHLHILDFKRQLFNNRSYDY